MERRVVVYREIREMIAQEEPGFARRVNHQMRQEQPALDADLWFQGREKEIELGGDPGLIDRAWKFH